MNSGPKTCSVISRKRQNDECPLNVNPVTHVFKVDILYGPINVCGIIKHRSERVEHIKSKSGASVHFVTTRVREKLDVFFRFSTIPFISFECTIIY